MGRLFENVTMDIQAERRNATEARAELNAARKELEAVWRERDTAQQERDTAQQERDIYKHILRMSRQHCSNLEILEALKQRFNLSEEQAKKKLEETFDE